MIKYNPKNWFKLIFAVHKSDTMRILWKELMYLGLLSLLIAYLVLNFMKNTEPLENLMSVYSLVGFVISLLLVFRTNTAYDRWYEGRKKWGALVNDTRNYAIKISVILKEEDDKEIFRRMIPNFVFASKEHLRDADVFSDLDLTDTERKEFEKKQHVPNAIVQTMYKKLFALKAEGKITEEEMIVLDKNVNALLDSLGACERIKNTPIPYSYMLFLKKFIFIYVVTLPLAMVSSFGYYSAIVVTFVFYVLVSMEVLAEEIEDPFGIDDNDLPTDSLCVKIRDNVREILS